MKAVDGKWLHFIALSWYIAASGLASIEELHISQE